MAGSIGATVGPVTLGLIAGWLGLASAFRIAAVIRDDRYRRLLAFGRLCRQPTRRRHRILFILASTTNTGGAQNEPICQTPRAPASTPCSEWGVDLLFLNYGPDFTYISGILKPMYYEILKTEGDWITGLVLGLDGDPVLVLHKYFAINIEAADLDPGHPHSARRPGSRRLSGTDHVGVQAQWQDHRHKQDVVGALATILQAAAPGARFVAATNDQMDAVAWGQG